MKRENMGRNWFSLRRFGEMENKQLAKCPEGRCFNFERGVPKRESE